MTFTAIVTTSRLYNGATVTNTASYSSAAFGGGVSKAAVFEIVRQTFYPIVGLEKTGSAPRPYPGAAITYTIGLTNYGDHTVPGLVLTDTLPAGVVGMPLAWSGDLRAGETRAFTLPAVITDDISFIGQIVTNTAYLVYSNTLYLAEAALVVKEAPAHMVYLPLVMRE
jgi:uncharacterized repeat protein (TIGR01451 family)